MVNLTYLNLTNSIETFALNYEAGMGGYPEIYKKGITKKVKGAKKGAKWEKVEKKVWKRAKKG